jgi:bla regulator protein blaR1
MEKIIAAFGWMLLHSLWQGLLLSIIAGVVLMLAKKSTAAYRYTIALVLFVAFLGITAFTFLFELSKVHASITLKPILPGNNYGGIIPALFAFDIQSIKQIMRTFTAYFSANQPLIVLIWFIFFLFKSVKMFACIIYNQQVRNRQVSEPSAIWVKKVAALAEKLQIKKAVKLLQSGYVKMPVVVGHLKPIILIPIGLMAGLPPEQIEAILLHELAHVRRNDYFVNFLQNIAEAIFFFNPGLLWISALLREERENCCDDIAVTQTQNKIGFVQALISFKEHELYGSKYATAFPGKKNYLMRRVSRILTNENKTFGFGEKLFFGLSLVLIVFVMSTVAFGKVRYRVNVAAINTHRKIVHRSTPALPDLANGGALKPIIPSKRNNEKMRDGISGINIKNTPSAHAKTDYREQPAQLAEAGTRLAKARQNLAKKREAFTDAQRAEEDEIQAKKDEQQALLDQKQALTDQAEALKDQAQAKIDQQEPEKEQLNAADQAQAQRNEQQAQRNREQEIRNREQVQRNEEQVKKNKEQELRNEEQARRNELQAKRNQEQALKNAASVKQ